MASGTPVLCSTSSSLPEVTGDAALGLHPDDVDAWAKGFVRIAHDEPLRARLAAQGRQRAAAFTWDRTVSGLRHVFRHVLAASPGPS
jgi:glycosyltransferase involved in cell wall biosynthesis